MTRHIQGIINKIDSWFHSGTLAGQKTVGCRIQSAEKDRQPGILCTGKLSPRNEKESERKQITR